VNQKIARVKELAHDYAYLTGQFRRSRALKRVCSICRYEGYFRPFGSPPRKDARCPNCGALERHRLLKLWLDQHGEEVVGREVLHFAPEEAMSALFRGLACKYISADIEEGRADTVLNIEAIELGDQTHGCIVCSHILEHVDDRKALREMRRVLRPGGIAIIMLPLVEGWSRTLFQDPSPEAAALRARAMPLIAEDPRRIPDHIFSGPDLPLNEQVRARFFGEC